MEYITSAVIRDKREELTVNAVSYKQAWYIFCKTYGYRHRDFKAIPIPVKKDKPKFEQLSIWS